MKKNDKAYEQISLLDESPSSSKPKPKLKLGSPASIRRAMQEMAAMRKEERWDVAEPRHLVALYAWCHEQVYGVAPAELVGYAWAGAVSAALALVRNEFRGDVPSAVDFLRWVWARERERESWRRRNRPDGGGSRIGWRLQFGRAMLTDYRIYLARKHKKEQR